MNDDVMSGEALVGDGAGIAHVDLMVGERDGPVGNAYASALGDPAPGHEGLSAIVAPNLAVKPPTVLVPTVTMKSMEDGEMMFGPAQKAVADAVADCVDDDTIPKEKMDNWCIVANVFIHPDAEDKEKVYDYNHEATKLSIKRAINDLPTPEEIKRERKEAEHPYA